MTRPDRRPSALMMVAAFALAALLAPAAPAALAAPARAAGAGPLTHVSVSPGSGHPSTRFALRLRIPEATGTFGAVVRRDVASVRGPRGNGCLSSVAKTLRPARRGARLELTLSPGKASWCPGEFTGRVVQSETLRCRSGPAKVCPYLVLAPRTIARFRFHVTASSTGGTGGPAPADRPTFSGLISATACNSPGPRVLPRLTGYTLTWQAATDPVTPSSAIVYDIYLATSPGAEDYAQPTWTTQPGVTSYTTPALTGSGPAYFVVRARNAAGHEDDNTVERQGISQCGTGPVM